MNPYILNKYTILDFIGVVLYKVVLDYSYTIFVVPLYSYMGFVLDFNLSKYIEGWIVYILLFLLLKRHNKHVLYMTLLVSFFLLIVPSITLYSFKNEQSGYFYSMMIPYAVMLLTITTKRVKLYYFPSSKKIAIIFSAIMVSIVFIHYIVTIGFGHINFDLSKVYELRQSEAGLKSNAGIFGYLNSWVAKVFNIFLIAIAILHRKFLFIILFIILQIILFGFSGHKAELFSLLLVFGLYFFDKIKHKSTIIIYSFLMLIVFLLIYFYILDEPVLPSILLRRSFFVPSHLNYVYFDYFSSHDYIYWSNSILKSFIHYPYDIDPVYVIGSYMGHPDMAANTGIFGSGYEHLGILGIIIYIFMLTLLINFIHQFKKLPFWLINSITLMPLLSLFISSDFFTALFTHGVFIAVLIVYLYSNDKKHINKDIFSGTYAN